MAKISELVSSRRSCGCGSSHTVTTSSARIGKNAVASLVGDVKTLVPPGVYSAVIYDEKDRDKVRRVEKDLLRVGYRVELIPLRQFADNAKDFRLLVGVGDRNLCDALKLAAANTQAKLFLVPTEICCAGSSFALSREKEGFILRKKAVPPDGIIYDPDMVEFGETGLAAGFGEVVSALFGAIDWRIRKCLCGERFCDRIYDEVKNTVKETTAFLSKADRRDEVVKIKIAEADTILSLIDQSSDGSVFGGGASASALCSCMLAVREGRFPRMFGETAFVYSRSLCEYYLSALRFMNTTKAFFAPPNNNRRAELIGEYLGIDAVHCDKHQKPIVFKRQLDLMNYRLSVYLDDFAKQLDEVLAVFEDAEKIFMRLYDDDGFGISGIREEGPLCAALAPDVSDEKSCLDYFKAFGLLDSLLY